MYTYICSYVCICKYNNHIYNININIYIYKLYIHVYRNIINIYNIFIVNRCMYTHIQCICMYTTYSLHSRYLTPAAGIFCHKTMPPRHRLGGWRSRKPQKSGVESMSKPRKFSTEMIFQSIWGESLLDGFFNHYMLGFAKSFLFSKLISDIGKKPTIVFFLALFLQRIPQHFRKKTTVDKLNFATRH